MSEWTFSFDELVEVNFDAPGVPGRKGDPGEGLPAGGTTGQFVRKASATDYDTEWVDVDAASVGADPAGTAADAYAAAVATAQGYTDSVSAADRVYIDNEIAGLAPVASSGAYSDLTGRPTLGTAAAQNTTAFATAAQGAKADTAIQDDDLGTSAYLDVPATGNALTTQVVKGNDSRLTNARPPTAHAHTKSDISDFSDGDYATAAQGALADSASQPGHAHTKSDISDFSDGDYATAAQGALADLASQPGHAHTKSDISDFSDGDYATAAQGALADSASQPGHAHTKSDISDFSDGDYATAAQGALADSASQPGHAHDISDLNTTGTPDGTKFLRDDGSWQTVAVGGAVYSVNTQTGPTYTLQLSDAGGLVRLTHANPSITIPPNSIVSFPVGTAIDLMAAGGPVTVIPNSSEASVYEAEVSADNPRVWWKLQEASGLFQDSSGGGRHATVSSGTITYQQTGLFSDAYSVIFAPGSIQRPSGDFGTTCYGMETWFRFSSNPVAKQALTSVGQFGLSGWIYIDTDGKLGFQVSGGADIKSPEVLSFDEWHHAIVTCGPSYGQRIYLDGELVTSNASTTAVSNSRWSIHKAEWLSNSDDLAVDMYSAIWYDTELSPARATSHYVSSDLVICQTVGTLVIDGINAGATLRKIDTDEWWLVGKLVAA